MKYQLAKSAALGMFVVGASATVVAAPVTDVKEYSNNTASEYFVDIDANKYNSPYYREADQDWGWVHNAIAGTFTTIELNISAFDVDANCGYFGCEVDMISIWDGSSWVGVGSLRGATDIWDFTAFDLTGFVWAQAQVNAGLQVRMDIDTLNAGWLVTLGKSSLSVDGGSQACVPTPGVPCNVVAVPEPTTLALLGLGLAGFGVRRLGKK